MDYTKERIKVVWLCHFSNKEVRKHLLFKSLFIERVFRLLLNKPSRTVHRDFAAWVSHQIIEFEKFENVELHIVAPHIGMRKASQELKINSISYHFFKPQGKGLVSRLISVINKKEETEYKKNRQKVKGLINKINPDIVDLIGAENPYYSICALDIEDKPLFLTCQTAYSSDLFEQRLAPKGTYSVFRKKLEIKIHQKVKYVGCEGVLHRNTVLKNNPHATVFRYTFANKKPDQGMLPKKYDFVFFAASLSESKGVEDLINALSIVKQQQRGVTLNIVGRCDPNYKLKLNELMLQNTLEGNVSFNDYFPEHADMYCHITQGRCAVLPIKLDEISSTVLESMMLSIPVITNKTTGTPFLNKDGECVLLSEIDNVQSLADNMLKVIDNDDLLNDLAKNAKAFVDKEFDNTNSAKRLLSDYRAILNHYYYEKPFPEKLLFNINDFKLKNLVSK